MKTKSGEHETTHVLLKIAPQEAYLVFPKFVDVLPAYEKSALRIVTVRKQIYSKED